MNHIPDKHEHLVRYYGHCSNRSRVARRQTKKRRSYNGINHSRPARHGQPAYEANWARLIQKVYKVDPLEYTNCQYRKYKSPFL